MPLRGPKNRNMGVQIYFNQELLNDVDEAAERLGMDRSPLVREALTHFLRCPEGYAQRMLAGEKSAE